MDGILNRSDISKAKRIVIKIGTTSLTYDNGHVNLNRIGHLTRVICDLMNRGKEARRLRRSNSP